MNKLFIFAAANAMALTASPALAQADADLTLVDEFDGPALGQALDKMGVQWERHVSDKGTLYIQMTFANGTKATALPKVCRGEVENTQCAGLRLMAGYTVPEGLSDEEIATRINRFNADFLPAKGFRSDNGEAYVSMYLIADYGITKSNLQTKLAVFQDLMGSFNKVLKGE